MARHGIGEFHLERVEMRVLADLLEALDFTFDVEVVLRDLVRCVEETSNAPFG